MNNIDKKTISKLLRDKSKKQNIEIIKDFGISKVEFYQAIRGKGSRNTRLKIAKIIEYPPSMLWSKNKDEVKLIDDLHYWGISK